MSNLAGVSVIIPCYNTGRYIREAVDSVRAQKTAVPHEIIIIDDGSSDPFTHETLAELKHEDPGIRLFYNGMNKGLPATRNVGLGYARYSYILPLDSDDKLSTDPALLERGGYIDRTFAALESNPDVVLAYSRVRLFDAVDHVFITQSAYDEKKLLSRNMVGAHNVFRKAEALKIHGYNEEMIHAEDWDITMRLLNNAIREGRQSTVHFIENPLFCYRRRSNNTSMMSNPKMTTEQVVRAMSTSSPEIYEKHYPGLAGSKLIDAVVHDRSAILAQEAKDLFKHCARHPLSSFFDGSFQLAYHEVPRVKKKISNHLSRFFGGATGGTDIDVPEIQETPGSLPQASLH
ncbi:MAG: glycosyltransferase [Alphaproteobacteria bacterium]